MLTETGFCDNHYTPKSISTWMEAFRFSGPFPETQDSQSSAPPLSDQRAQVLIPLFSRIQVSSSLIPQDPRVCS